MDGVGLVLNEIGGRAWSINGSVPKGNGNERKKTDDKKLANPSLCWNASLCFSFYIFSNTQNGYAGPKKTPSTKENLTPILKPTTEPPYLLHNNTQPLPALPSAPLALLL